MNHQPEHLSAAMDGELTGEELRFLLRRLDHDSSLQVRWEHFHVASASLRHELPVLASPSFADRVMRAIGDEAAVAEAPRGRRHGWLKFSAGGAIAASVAVAALMASRPSGPTVESTPNVASVAQASDVSGRAAKSPEQVLSASPATVPRWLSANNPLSMTQMASYPQGDSISPYEQSVSPYRVKATRPAADGSYLILIDPSTMRQPVRRPVHEAAVAQ
jgi:sigma-E factor negative regulatory protein RseA